MNILIQCQSYAIIMYKDSLNRKHKLILLLIIVLFEYIKTYNYFNILFYIYILIVNLTYFIMLFNIVF